MEKNLWIQLRGFFNGLSHTRFLVLTDNTTRRLCSSNLTNSLFYFHLYMPEDWLIARSTAQIFPSSSPRIRCHLAVWISSVLANTLPVCSHWRWRTLRAILCSSKHPPPKKNYWLLAANKWSGRVSSQKWLSECAHGAKVLKEGGQVQFSTMCMYTYVQPGWQFHSI